MSTKSMNSSVKRGHQTVLLALALLGFIFLSGCGLGVYWLTQTNVYPEAERLTGVGKCGTAERYAHGRTIRLATQRCFTTADSPAHIGHWYLTRGYQWQNDGYVQHNSVEAGVVLIRTERIYPLPLQHGRTDIRIYTDYTMRLP